MEYQKIANFLADASNKPSKLRTKNWVKINDNIRVHTLLIKKLFKTAMLRSSLCDQSDAHILVKRNTSVSNNAAAGVAANNKMKNNI